MKAKSESEEMLRASKKKTPRILKKENEPVMRRMGTWKHEEWSQTMEDDRYKEHGGMKVRTFP